MPKRKLFPPVLSSRAGDSLMRGASSLAVVSTILVLALVSAGRAQNPTLKHVKVYAEAGRFGGWPANHGIWSWGNEILVGFSAGHYKERPADRHQQDPAKPEEPRLARSLD